MDYKNKLQKPSFRGVPFGIKDINTTLGRRTILHEYPGRDDPYAEDLGRKAREFSINIFVMNPNDYTQSEALRAALEDSSLPGTLIHPTMGQMQVVVKDCTHTYSNNEGGIEYFSVTFVESRGNNFPSLSVDTQSRLRASVGNLITSSNNYFANNFSTSHYPDYIAHSAVVNLNAFAANFRNIINFGSARNGTPSNYSRLIANLNKFVTDIPTLITTPLKLSETINGLNKDLNASFTGNLDLANLLQGRLYEYGNDFLVLVPTTTLRGVEKTNQDQLVYLIRISALAAMLSNISAMSFASAGDAVDARNNIDNRAWPLLNALANNFEDELHTKLTDALTAMVQDIGARVVNSATTSTRRIADSKPAIVLAYEFLEDAAKDADLVARNKITNPLFVPAQSDVSVVNG